MPVCEHETISVDLIRWKLDIDVPLMDGLYLKMLLWAKEQGYSKFNMGMATLSNVGQVQFSFYGERIAYLASNESNLQISFHAHIPA